MSAPDLQAWAALLAFYAVGAGPAVWAVWPRRGRGGVLEALLLGLVVGPPQMILLALGAFLAGLPVVPSSLAVPAAAHLLVCAIWRRLQRGDPAPASLPREARPVFLLLSALGVLIVLSLALMSYPMSDSLYHWVARPWTFAVEGSMTLLPFSHHPSYPLAISIGHIPFLLHGSSIGVAFWQHAYLLAALLYAGLFLARRHGRAGLIVAVLFLPPQFLMLTWIGQGHILMADTTLAAAILLACVFLIETVEEGRPRHWAAIISLAFALMSKSNGVYLLALLGCAYAAVVLLPSRGPRWPRPFAADRLALLLVPAVILVLWAVFLREHKIRNELTAVAFGGARREMLRTDGAAQIVLHKAILNTSYFLEWAFLKKPWLPQAPAKLGWAMVLVTLGLLSWRSLPPTERFLGLFAAATLGALVGVIFVLTGYTDDSGARWSLVASFTRSLVHVVPIFLLALELRLARSLTDIRQATGAWRRAGRGWRPWAIGAGMALLLVASSFGILRAYNVSHEDWTAPAPFLRRLFPAEAKIYKRDPYGFYLPEMWDWRKMRWMANKLDLRLRRKGDVLIATYFVGHPDISEENPVEVRIRIRGGGDSTARHVERGIYQQEVHAGPGTSVLLRLRIHVSRIFLVEEDDRKFGIALASWEWR